MNVGRMTHKVDLQRATTSTDDYGQPVTSWTTYATVWAAKVPLGIREQLQQQQVQAVSSTRWSVRYRSDVTVADRIIDGSEEWEVSDVTDVEDRRQELLILCKRAV